MGTRNKKLKLELVHDWKRCWKWFSLWCMAATGAIGATWEWLPQDWKQVLLTDASAGVAFKIISIISAAGIFGRLVNQGVNNAKNN